MIGGTATRPYVGTNKAPLCKGEIHKQPLGGITTKKKSALTTSAVVTVSSAAVRGLLKGNLVKMDGIEVTVLSASKILDN